MTDPSLSPDLLKSHESSSALRERKVWCYCPNCHTGFLNSVWSDGAPARELAVDRSRSIPKKEVDLAVAASPPTTQDREPFQTCGEWRLPKVGPTCWRQAGHEGDHCGGQEGCVGGVVSWSTPSSPTSEPIPASGMSRTERAEFNDANRPFARKVEVVSSSRVPASDRQALISEMAAQASLGHKRFCVGAHEHESGELEYEWIDWTEAFARLLKPSRIPASDQLREALDKLDSAIMDYQWGSGSSDISAARAAVEELFGAQLGEIERLRKSQQDYIDLNADYHRQLIDAHAELASLRSSSLTAEEAAEVVANLTEGEPCEYHWWSLIKKLRATAALRSSTPDKGIEK